MSSWTEFTSNLKTVCISTPKYAKFLNRIMLCNKMPGAIQLYTILKLTEYNRTLVTTEADCAMDTLSQGSASHSTYWEFNIKMV